MNPTVAKHVEIWFPRLKTCLDVGLIAAMAWLMASLVWLVIEPRGVVSPSVPLIAMTAPGPQTVAMPEANLSVLTRFSRFGRADAPESFTTDAPPTNLDLVLKGVRTAPNLVEPERLQRAIAMIEVPGGQIKTVRPGETIIERVTLNTVLADRVLILKDGQLETLLMESSAGRLAVLSLPGQDGLVTGAPSSNAKSPSGATNDTQPGNDPQRPLSPKAMVAALDISPVIQEGVTVGYRLDSGVAAPLLAQSGFQSGDVITTINGVNVTETGPEQIISQLKSASSVNVTVLRGGVARSLTLSFPSGGN